ncbi:MAG: amidohydrolase family protein [Actinomycetota bacterium]
MPATILAGGTVVTSLCPPRVAERDLAIAEGRVADVDEVNGGAVRVDASGSLILPGNVCAHHHLYSALARGMPYRLAPPETFLQVLRRIWWRLDRALDDGSVAASALVGGADALLAGTTTIVDHHASPEAIDGSLSRIADALEALGLRSVLAYEVTDRDGPERARAGVEENRRFAKERRPMSAGMVGAHASFTLSPDTLAECIGVARDVGSGLHIHAAEDAVDETDCEHRFGVRVAHRLDAAGGLADRDVLAHAIHLDEDERELVEGSGAWIVHNPRSNMNNRVGHLRTPGLGRVALGTDGIGGDMFAESRAAFWRAREADPSVGPGWVLDRIAGSANAAGLALGEPALGTLEPGAPADLLVMDHAPPTPLNDGNLAAHWVFGLSSRMIRDVYVAGERVVEDGRLARMDAREIASSGATNARRLWERMDGIDEHPFDPAGGWAR